MKFEEVINSSGDILKGEWDHNSEIWEGNYKIFDKNSNLVETGFYKNNKKQGSVKSYNNKGNFVMDSIYLDGIIQKETKYEYYLNGIIKEITTKEKGKFILNEKYYDNGELEYKNDGAKSENFSKDGKIIKRVWFSNNPKKNKVEFPGLMILLKTINKENCIKIIVESQEELKLVKEEFKNYLKKNNITGFKINVDSNNPNDIYILK
jgi:antitoxin component YwqK of YwqJK toxin-antitoxin module